MEESSVPLPEMAKEVQAFVRRSHIPADVKVRWMLLYTNEAGNNYLRIRYENYRHGSINIIPAAYSISGRTVRFSGKFSYNFCH